MKHHGILTVATAIGALVTGCAERKVEYVPAYQAPPTYQAYPAYTYQPQAAYEGAPPPAQPDTTPTVAPQSELPPQPVPDTVVVQAPPPPPRVEYVPLAPGPTYVWVPGYWSWRVGGGWMWVGGHYVVRPHPHAVWVGGHWTRHGHGYVWIGGHWR
ncbi:MAG TPA: hypothetical protein VL361_02020 [Candidatus Limnocylindrales bacterium]|jgi:hypothetical protein|nr:hypothetical protein [Candidatus Limnocylindrales bacterium]